MSPQRPVWSETWGSRRPLLDGHRNELVALNLPLGQANRLSVANVRHVDEHSPGIRKPEWDTNRVNSPGATFWHLEPTKIFVADVLNWRFQVFVPTKASGKLSEYVPTERKYFAYKPSDGYVYRSPGSPVKQQGRRR
jgi:hypothetical protein